MVRAAGGEHARVAVVSKATHSHEFVHRCSFNANVITTLLCAPLKLSV